MRKGWEIKKLGDCFKLRSGELLTAKMMNSNGSYPVYGGNGISGYHDQFNLSGSNVIVGRVGALCGNVRHMTEDIWLTDNGFQVIDYKIQFDHAFLTYLLNYKNLRSFARQSAQPVISNSSLTDVVLEFPKDVTEQQRIVSILDEAFEAIDQAKASTEKNLQNAKELFQSELNSIFTNKGEGWVEKKLKDICELKPQKKEARDKLKESDLVTFLPMEDLGIGKKEIYPTQEKPLKDVSGSYTYFADNDVLLAKITPCFENGKIGIATNLKNGIGFGSSEYIVFRSNGLIDPELLFYFLSRKSFREEGKPLMSGAVGHRRVSKEWIDNYLMPFPKSLSDQKHIINQLDTLSAETKQLEENYRKQLESLEELKKSILQKAFSGELTSPERVASDNDGCSPSTE